MTKKEIHREGAKIFKKIERHVSVLAASEALSLMRYRYNLYVDEN